MGDLPWLWENGRPMGICRGYGRMAGLWGSVKTYGEMCQACGCIGRPRNLWEMTYVWEAAESHVGTAIPYGKCHGIWEPAPAHGEAARPYGKPKSHQNQKYWNGGRLVDFVDFNEFLVGTVVLWEAVEMHGDQWNTAMHERLCLILVIWTRRSPYLNRAFYSA